LDVNHWKTWLTSPVNFLGALDHIGNLVNESDKLVAIIEMGPHPVFTAASAALTSKGAMVKAHIVSMKRGEGGRGFLQGQRDLLEGHRTSFETNDALSAIRSHITSAVEQICSSPHIDTTRPLMAQGLDSSGAIRLTTTLKAQYAVDLDPTIVFDYPTVDTLCRHVFQIMKVDEASLVLPPTDDLKLPQLSTSMRLTITGVSCRLPTSITTPHQFWNTVQTASCHVDKVPLDRWDVDAVTAAKDTLGRDVCRRMAWGGFVEQLERFDAGFFGISTAEASAMDPQQRLLLESSELAFNDAQCQREALEGQSVGVFVGISNSDAMELGAKKTEIIYLRAAGPLCSLRHRLFVRNCRSTCSHAVDATL
jgi:acyl carrier protein